MFLSGAGRCCGSNTTQPQPKHESDDTAERVARHRPISTAVLSPSTQQRHQQQDDDGHLQEEHQGHGREHDPLGGLDEILLGVGR